MDGEVRIIEAALKHGVDVATILSVLASPIYSARDRRDPPKVKVLGIDGALRPVEVVYVVNEDGTRVVVHAMAATKVFLEAARRARKESR